MKTISSFTSAPVVFMISICAFFIMSCSDDNESNTAPPEVTGISPMEGPKTTLVTISGTNFSATLSENIVTINEKAATVTAASATQLTVMIPKAADSGPIVVKTRGQVASNQPAFTYHWTVVTLAGSDQGYLDGSPAKFNSPSGIAADSLGNTYITDFGNHVIRKTTPAGVVSTVAGSTLGVADGIATAAMFYYPNGSAVDKLGNIYISEEGACRVRKITPLGEVSTFAGDIIGNADGIGMSAQFKQPSGIAIDKQDNLYVADQLNHRIRKITPAGIVTTLAGSTQGYADGAGTGAQFYRPTGVVVDAQGNVFVADLFNHKIRKISSSGSVTTIAGSAYGFAEGNASTAKFAYPAGLALDKTGNLYVADSENHRIRKITPAGVVSTFAGSGTAGANDGIADVAQFFAPREVDVDAAGSIYVVDAGSHKIRRID
ncbi:MAG TPA: IPT/TIG domain-containing protein [Chryseolinea sp.]|nr:IPT/TIG domain-containing protein [Chryseolinea sp.]